MINTFDDCFNQKHYTLVKKSKAYEIVGELFVKKGPETASKAAHSLMSVKASECDFDKISEFYSRFCSIENITELKSTDKKLFISCILHLYHPIGFCVPVQYLTIPYGLAATLANVLGCSQPGISQIVRQVILEESVYDDFREKVKEMVDKIKG